MKNRTSLAIFSAIVLGLFMAGSAIAAERRAQAATGAATYVDENTTEPEALHLRRLEGSVEGLGGEPMPQAQVSLFTENGHSLIATVASDGRGRFHFDKVEKGLYRVVARVTGLCPANIPVKFESSLLAKRKLIITMRPKDLDTCSYGIAK